MIYADYLPKMGAKGWLFDSQQFVWTLLLMQQEPFMLMMRPDTAGLWYNGRRTRYPLGKRRRTMSIGYACLTLGVRGTDLGTCMIRNADEARLNALITANLEALEKMISYNMDKGIRVFRISSDIIPFASSPVNKIPWTQTFGERLACIGHRIRQSGMRVSMHPGQYTVLNSPNELTAQNAVRDLAYHAAFLDSLQVDKTHKIILHIGGAYGDRPSAVLRFAQRYQALSDAVKARLVIENDDRIYNIREVLDIGLGNRIPVVFDNLHHQTNPPDETAADAAWITACAQTWASDDGRQKIHYSQADPRRKRGAHSLSIEIDEFLRFYHQLQRPKPDIMLEVKDKNISAVKCLLCTAREGSIAALEREWGRYKYLVLEHSQQTYSRIRELLKDKASFPALAFFRQVQAALALPAALGDALNAAAHVWGYFKDAATARQKADILKAMDGCGSGKVSIAALKRKLYALAEMYGADYLLESYYFVGCYDGLPASADEN